MVNENLTAFRDALLTTELPELRRRVLEPLRMLSGRCILWRTLGFSKDEELESFAESVANEIANEILAIRDRDADKA